MKRSILFSLLIMALSVVCYAQMTTTAQVAAAASFSIPPAVMFLIKMIGFGGVLKFILSINVKGKDIMMYAPASIRSEAVDVLSVLVYWVFQLSIGQTSIGAIKADGMSIVLQGLANSSTLNLIHNTNPWISSLLDSWQSVTPAPAAPTTPAAPTK